jgi:hypothetical protein
MGIKEGRYQLRPQTAPQFRRTEIPFLDKVEAELQSQIVREIAQRIYNRLPRKEAFLNEIETVVSNNLAGKNLYDILNGTNL